MISRILDLIFVDFFALAINKTAGALLRTKICNYSWEHTPEIEQKKDDVNSHQSL